MTGKTAFKIAVLPGDGIGPEVIAPAVKLLNRASILTGGFTMEFEWLKAGALYYQEHGISIPDEALDIIRDADAILLGAMGLPEIRYPDGTEISPQLELREKLGLYAGVRPIRTIPGVPRPLVDKRAENLDFVLVRESTEGLFAARGKCEIGSDDVARDTMEISRATSEKLFDFAFELAAKRKRDGYPGHVTCIDKANVLGSFAFFRRIFDERAELFPEIEAKHCYVDAASFNLIKQPWTFDVMVTENMLEHALEPVAQTKAVDPSHNELEPDSEVVLLQQSSPITEPLETALPEATDPAPILQDRITDADTGKPIVDAFVTTRPVNGTWADGVYHASTNADGIYVFKFVGDEGDYWIYPEANRYLQTPPRKMIELLKDSPKTWDFTLSERGATLLVMADS